MARRQTLPARLTTNDGRPKPWTVLTVVRSESGSWEYEIRTSHKTGVTYCTCNSYAFRKRCKHLDAFNASPIFRNGTAPNAPAVDLAETLQRPVWRNDTAAETLRSVLIELADVRISLTLSETIIARLSPALDAKPRPTTNVRTTEAGIRVITLPD